MKVIRHNYFIVIYESGDVLHLSRMGEVPTSPIRFLICAKYDHESAGGTTVYYRYSIFDSNNAPIEGNKFHWDWIECSLIDRDVWENAGEVRSPNHNSIFVKVQVIDKLGENRVKRFPNHKHDGNAFKELMEYLKHLLIAGTHSGADALFAMEKELAALKQKMNES